MEAQRSSNLQEIAVKLLNGRSELQDRGSIR